jgi:hypothetical protein
MGYDMAEPVQLRILPNNGSGWYWEVINQDREMIARGIAVTHAQARIDMMSAVVSTPVPKPIRSTQVHL